MQTFQFIYKYKFFILYTKVMMIKTQQVYFVKLTPKISINVLYI